MFGFAVSCSYFYWLGDVLMSHYFLHSLFLFVFVFPVWVGGCVFYAVLCSGVVLLLPHSSGPEEVKVGAGRTLGLMITDPDTHGDIFMSGLFHVVLSFITHDHGGKVCK